MNARKVLAPEGRLRIGVFPGSPLSMALDRATGEMHGLGIDLGQELARRLGVAFVNGLQTYHAEARRWVPGHMHRSYFQVETIRNKRSCK